MADFELNDFKPEGEEQRGDVPDVPRSARDLEAVYDIPVQV